MNTPLVIRFVSGNPNESLDAATQSMVRSHAMTEFRKRQREQKKVEVEKRRKEQTQKALTGSLCTCISALKEAQDLPAPTVHRDKAQRITEYLSDSFKLCPKCGKSQFFELSPNGQHEFLKRQFPSITGFVAADFDPFGSMAIPELPGGTLSIRDTQELNRIKAHGMWPLYSKTFKEFIPATSSVVVLLQ
jgi:hypothetical protein